MNPYKVLGVKKKATDKEIKKAYIELAKKHHPDVGGDAEKFKKIGKAYEILKDPELRKAYDKDGIIPGSERENNIMTVMSLFEAHIFERTNSDLDICIEVIAKNITKRIEKVKKELENRKIILARIEKTRKKVKMKKSKKFNCYESAVSNLCLKINDQIKELKVSISLSEKLLNLANNYETIDKRNRISTSAKDLRATFVPLQWG